MLKTKTTAILSTKRRKKRSVKMDKEDRYNRKENKSSEIYIDEQLQRPYIIPAHRMERERRIAENIRELAKSLNEQFVSVHIDVTVKKT